MGYIFPNVGPETRIRSRTIKKRCITRKQFHIAFKAIYSKSIMVQVKNLAKRWLPYFHRIRFWTFLNYPLFSYGRVFFSFSLILSQM